MSALSLSQMIMRQHGDDIAAAVADLQRLAGFPKETAERIATGELPMDEASRQARKTEQGYGDTYLHGGAEQITELDGGLLGSATGAKTAKQAFWSTKDPRTAGSYANHAAKDAPVRRKLEEANKAGDSGDWDRHDQLIDEAEALEKEVYNQPLQGQMITPITVKGPKAQMEARGRSFDDFGMSDEIGERIRGASHDGFSGVEISDLDDAVGLSNQPADHLATIDLESVRSPNAAFDPQYTGSNIMGGLLAGGVGLGALSQSEDADAGFVTRGGKTLLEAFHGSPHKFDRFSMDAIGTGEGAQAYGHGLYFADSRDVAEGYKKALEKGGGLSDDDTMARVLGSVDGDVGKAVAELRRRGNASLQGDTPENAKRFFRMAQRVDGGYDPRGQLYRTEIDVTPESLLDWDKPLSEQSEAVQEVLGPYRSDFSPLTGGALNLATDALGKGVPEKMLSERGIKGIKYLDGDSRAVGDGTSNYVIFDDSLINIAERGNADPRLLAGTAAATAGGLGLLASNDADAGPVTAVAKALLDSNFTEQAVDSAVKQAGAYKSREALTLMDIDEFLNLAQKGYAPDKFDALQDVDKFDEVPFLSVGYRDGSDGVAHVTGHEGRHRAMTLRDRGETQIPVRVRGDIRWDQQDAPNFDYIEDWPTLLASENEGVTTPFPFKRGDSNLLDSSDIALRSKYTPPKKPEPKPDNYDTELLAELLDEFNFERGNADPRLLGATAAGTAGLLAAGQSEDADASVAGRLLVEGPQAYAQLRKLVARNKQKGISPGNTVKQWIHDKKNTNYDHMGDYAKKVDGGAGGDYYKQQVDSIVSQLLDGVESPDKDLLAGIEEWSGIRRGRELGYKPAHLAAAGAAATAAGGANAQEGVLAQPTTPQERGFKTWEEVSRDPTAPLPAPGWGEQFGKAGSLLMDIADLPMTGLQGVARGLWGMVNGEDLVTAGAQANHMMQGGSQEGFDRVGDQVEGLLKPIDRQFPYLNLSKTAGDTVGLGLGLLSPF